MALKQKCIPQLIEERAIPKNEEAGRSIIARGPLKS